LELIKTHIAEQGGEVIQQSMYTFYINFIVFSYQFI
jgi:hypothetical protein